MTTTVPTGALAGHHAALAARLDELAEELGVPGAVVGVLKAGETDIATHGVTSLENPVPVDAGTLFQIGSTSKTYTATALMVLVERGLVDLDATVRTYIPDLRLGDESVAAAVTARHLLTHTGGWVGDIFTDTGDGDDAVERFVQGLRDVEQAHPLGTIASYNNAGFSIAGRVIERVTGTPYAAALRELVLAPLGLQESWLLPADVMTRRFAVGHTERDGETVVARPWPIPRSVWPAGGVVSSIGDQLRYAAFHLGDGTGVDGARVLERATLEQMQTPQFRLSGGILGDHVGLSWMLRDVDGQRVVAHGGSTHGQMAAFEMVPGQNFAIAVLTNADAGTILNHRLVRWALEEYCGIAQPEVEGVVLSPDELAAYAGTFDSRTSIIEVRVDGDMLAMSTRLSEEGRRQLAAMVGEEQAAEEKAEEVHLRPDGRDGLVIVDGRLQGMRITVLRDEAGEVDGIDLGRVARRVRTQAPVS